MDETFSTINTATCDPKLNVPKIHLPYSCCSSAASMSKPSWPQKTWSNNGVKQQVTLISSISRNSLDHSPIERSLVLYVPPPTISAEGHGCLIQPTSTIKPPAQVKSCTKDTKDMKQAICIDCRGLQWFWDSNKYE